MNFIFWFEDLKLMAQSWELLNITQLKLPTGMQYKGVTQRCCPWLLLGSGNNTIDVNSHANSFSPNFYRTDLPVLKLPARLRQGRLRR